MRLKGRCQEAVGPADGRLRLARRGAACHRSPGKRQSWALSVGTGPSMSWAAVVFFEMITRERPFAGNDIATTMYRFAHEPPPRPSSTPRSVRKSRPSSIAPAAPPIPATQPTFPPPAPRGRPVLAPIPGMGVSWGLPAVSGSDSGPALPVIPSFATAHETRATALEAVALNMSGPRARDVHGATRPAYSSASAGMLMAPSGSTMYSISRSSSSSSSLGGGGGGGSSTGMRTDL